MLDEAEAADEHVNEKQPDQPKAVTTTRVLADGTYATETVFSSTADAARLEKVRAASKPPLRALILSGDFYTGSVLAATLTKLVLRYAESASDDGSINSIRAESILIMTSIIRVGQSKFSVVPIDEDSQERIMNCIETLAELQKSGVMADVFLRDTKAAYSTMVKTEEKKALAKKEKEDKAHVIQADDLISFRQLSKKAAGGDLDDVSCIGGSFLTRSLIRTLYERLELGSFKTTSFPSCPE